MIRQEDIAIDGRATCLWTGGDGDPLLLLHGAWGGAALHWASVWEPLAEECRVISPEVPGLAHESPWVPASLDESAHWALQVLDACRAPRAWVAGDSLGAAVASRPASHSPERCLGLILIDGGPPPSMPAAVRHLMRRRLLRALMQGLLRRSAYGTSALLGSTTKVGRQLKKSLAEARLVVIPGAGHLPQLEQPGPFVAAVVQFVRNR
jgi:pimeloyl-ACP methyl ester carboxylesterase